MNCDPSEPDWVDPPSSAAWSGEQGEQMVGTPHGGYGGEVILTATQVKSEAARQRRQRKAWDQRGFSIGFQ